jgi:hypothetical protein
MSQIPHRYVSPQGSRGQIVVEYVLILVVVISVAFLITKLTVNRDTDSPGFIVSRWNSMINAVGKDKPDSAD